MQNPAPSLTQLHHAKGYQYLYASNNLTGALPSEHLKLMPQGSIEGQILVQK